MTSHRLIDGALGGVALLVGVLGGWMSSRLDPPGAETTSATHCLPPTDAEAAASRSRRAAGPLEGPPAQPAAATWSDRQHWRAAVAAAGQESRLGAPEEAVCEHSVCMAAWLVDGSEAMGAEALAQSLAVELALDQSGLAVTMFAMTRPRGVVLIAVEGEADAVSADNDLGVRAGDMADRVGELFDTG